MNYDAYIESLEAAGILLTHEEWIDLIKKESADFSHQDERHKPPTEKEIESIVEKLKSDGFVKS